MATVVPELSPKAWPKILVLLLASAAGAVFVSAQTPSLLQAQKQAPTQPPPPSDSLGRDTPRGTVVGFIQAAQYERDTAVEFFQPQGKSHRSTPEDEHELAGQLLAVLNARFPSSALATLSRDPLAPGDDGQPQNQIKIGGTPSLSETFPIILVRLDDPHDNKLKLWFISRQTLEQVPEAYDSLRFPRIEKELPQFLVKNRPVGMPLWQWIAILLLAPIALALGWLVASLTRLGSGFVRRLRGRPPLTEESHRRFGPGALLVAALIHYYFVYFIGASLLYRQYYRQVIWVFLAFAFYWAVTRVTHRISRDIAERLTDRGRLAERSLVSLTRRVLDVLIFIILGLYLLKSLFDVNVTAALAGLGIGGLAIGLGAQKTFENLLGGISILTDKAIVVGDPCRIGDQRGVVEDIGLRSTKLRTEDRTVVSIPNGTVATAVLENYRLRDKILCRQTLRLRYDLSPDHLRHVLAEVREALQGHAKVEEGSSRVRLLRFGETAIEAEIYAYILERDYGEFLATQEDLLLQVMETLERTGGAVALPSQTTVVTQDQYVDPEKAAAAQKAIEKTRAPGAQRP
jgi:MscS family membrane protein